MFYCNACGTKNDWPTTLVGSFGPCECCGAHTYCNDLAAKYLPLPKEVEPRYNMEIGEEE